jgi:ABC-type nickel/cobalt efflux system permease component RcnA
VVELLFGVTSLIPQERNAMVMEEGISWNYTTWLNIAFLVLAVVLVTRFFRTGGVEMLRMMGGGPDDHTTHNHTTGHDHGAAHETGHDHGAHHEPEHTEHHEHDPTNTTDR